MSKILIFAGTTEGRKLSEHLCERGIGHTVCVATEYGEIVLHENPFAHVHMGRMDSEGMRSFFAEQKCKLIVDATHPYAAIVTENIKQAVYAFNEAHAVTDNQADSSISENIEYVRLKRDTDISADYDNIRYFEDNEACAKALNNTDGNILLTTGSKELSVYCKTSDVRERLYVRVLPGLESISLCMHNDITGKHILALQGPFSTQLNEALIDQYDIRCLVTKKSGAAGGFIEKMAAAKNKNILVYIVGQSVQDDGMSFEAVCEYIDRKYNKLHIMLAGIGMGNDAVTVAKECEFVKAYLALQKYRFGERLNYNIDIEADCMECQVPKLTLVTFVENACVHGIESKAAPGWIFVRIFKKAGFMHIEVEDTGSGIDPDALEKMKSNMKNADIDMLKTGGRVGVINACLRIKMVTESKAVFDVDSEEGCGTIVMIKIPETYL